MKQTCVMICAFWAVILPAPFLNGQNAELGIYGGVTQYMGDLAERNIMAENIQPVVGLSLKYNVSPYFGIKSALSTGYLHGSDAYATDVFRQNRNLSFRTDLVEFAALAEVSLMDIRVSHFTPYFFAGVAGFYFNPRAQYNGEWYDLQPLTTEGQGTSAKPGTAPYSRITLAIPLGAGLKVKLSDRFALGVEAGSRKTFTDYIDDVSTTYVDRQVLLNERGPVSAALSDRSGEVMAEPPARTTGEQRGNPEVWDYYGFGTVNLHILLGKGAHSKGDKKYGCPVKL